MWVHILRGYLYSVLVISWGAAVGIMDKGGVSDGHTRMGDSARVDNGSSPRLCTVGVDPELWIFDWRLRPTPQKGTSKHYFFKQFLFSILKTKMLCQRKGRVTLPPPNTTCPQMKIHQGGVPGGLQSHNNDDRPDRRKISSGVRGHGSGWGWPA